jgi:diguanylate cyclase (GGDEF)-like protein
MLALEALKRNAHWAGLLLLSALIGATAIFTPTQISTLELEREALVAAQRLHAQVMQEPGTLLNALSRPGLAPELSTVFEHTGYASRVLRYELYDEAGRLTFTSGQAGLEFAEPFDARTLADTKVTVHQGAQANGPSNFAVLSLPFRLSGQPRGALVVYLDQSDSAEALANYFGLIVAITLLLLFAGMATPIAYAWMRIQQHRQVTEQVHYLETHDSLTGLPNRRAFSERLAEALVRMDRDHTHIAVLCLDVDKFKEINDSTDIAGGDAVLREMGSRIQSTLRERDLIARRGADEFAITLVDITNLGEVMTFMNKLVEALRRPFRIADKDVVCTTSVGIALAPSDGTTAAEVLRHADIALARARSDGGQRMCFFEQSMDRALQRRRTVEHELRLALAREEFEVVYQPQFDLAAETQCGVEALVRWHHPVHGKIAPAHFISVAEDTGLIVPLGEWVLRRACSDAMKWPEPLTVAVNLSPAQFRDGDVAETVADVLHETGLPAHRLELEITESLLINDTDEVLAKLNRLRDLGVAIAMDDFGTGYSSLSYLARFPFNKIKIDRQFIRNMTRDPAMRAIVKTIIALGKSLDVAITAEGVETPEQAAMLREFGCPQVQGFLYGYPTTAEAVTKGPIKVAQIAAERSSAA